MVKPRIGLLIALSVMLTACSAPSISSYISGDGVKLRILNPIGNLVASTSPQSGSRFVTSSPGQIIRVTITGTGIITPISGIASPNGDSTYTATLTIPTGSERTVLVQAYDASGNMYASISTTLDLSGGMPEINLQLKPEAQNAADASTGSFIMQAGKIAVYKRTITAADFPYSYDYFGVSLNIDDQTTFDESDFYSVIDSAGNVIMPPETLYDPNSLSSFFKVNQDISPYEGTFYLILWGNSNHNGSIYNFPIINWG